MITRRGFLRFIGGSRPVRRVAQRLCGRHRADAADACEALFADAAGLAGWPASCASSHLPTSMPAGHG